MEKENRSIRLVLVLFYALLIIRNAWVSDDAMITFRPIENFLAGYGLGYNPFVRVQAFTHPLWMLLLASVYFPTTHILSSSAGTLFYITIFLSIVLSCVTVYLLISQVARPNILSISVPLLILALSSSFVDFSTSGLENPLTHFLLILFLWLYCIETPNILLLSLIASLITLNRMDAFLLVAPALLYLFWNAPDKRRVFTQTLLGFLPLVVWEIFSVFYFGFPFPNTAYAKLNTGIQDTLLMQQGLDYLLNSINWEPLIFFTIGLAGLSLYQHPDHKKISLYVGVMLYLIYVVKIGGDFMSGRFLTAPLLISAAILSSLKISRRFILVGGMIVLLLGVVTYRSPLWGSNMLNVFSNYPLGDRNGISDQRLFYFGNPAENQYNSFVENGFRNGDFGSEFAGSKWDFVEYKRVTVVDALGKLGYQRGPNIYVIDDFALADPLLARLPVRNKYWQIGHFHRDIPVGYLETLETGTNQIADADLAAYYSKLEFVVRGPLWNWQRIVEIWKLNTGQYDYLLDRYNERDIN